MSANIRVRFLVRQKAYLVQHDSIGNQCWFKLLESDHEQLILGMFQYSTIWKAISWCNTFLSTQGGVITSKLFSKYMSIL